MATPLPDPRRDQLRMVAEVDARLQRALLDATRDFQRILNRDVRTMSQGVTNAQTMRIYAQLRRVVGSLWRNDVPQSIAYMMAKAEHIAQRGGDAMDMYLLARIESPLRQDMLSKAFNLRAQNVVEVLKVREETAKFELANTVYKWEALSHDIVERRIASAMALGKPWNEIARDVRGLIDPNVRGGISYAAKRLGRTEVANAYHAATVSRYAGNPFVEGLRWSLSGSHPKPDECDDYAHRGSPQLPPGVYRVSDVPAKPHPQCLCHLQPEPVSLAFIEKGLKDGRFDSYLEGEYGGLGSTDFLSRSVRETQTRRS